MKHTITVALIASLVVSPASAGQKPIEWEKVRKLSPGTEVVLTVAGHQPAKVRFLLADDTALVTLKATGPLLSNDFLDGLARHWQDIVDRGATYKFGSLRVSRDGLFVADKKLTDLADLSQRTPRAEVVEVLVHRSWWSQNWKWFVPVVIGIYLLAGFLGSIPST